MCNYVIFRGPALLITCHRILHCVVTEYRVMHDVTVVYQRALQRNSFTFTNNVFVSKLHVYLESGSI